MEQRFLTPEHIAHDLGVKVETVRGWIRDKKLPAFRIGKEYRIKKEDYEKFLEERRTDKGDP